MKCEVFTAKTPLGVTVRTTPEYWEYLIAVKHPVMRGRKKVVKAVLEAPSEIRQSKTDPKVYLYYGQSDRMYCVVVKHEQDGNGFLITAYPVMKIKEGEMIWKK